MIYYIVLIVNMNVLYIICRFIKSTKSKRHKLQSLRSRSKLLHHSPSYRITHEHPEFRFLLLLLVLLVPLVPRYLSDSDCRLHGPHQPAVADL